MKLTQEMIEQQVREAASGIENYKQGYNAAMAWIAGILEAEKRAEEKKDTVDAAVE